MRDPLARYQTMQVQTAGRGQLLLMLLDGAIERLHLAARALEKGDPQAAQKPVWRAQAIVLELVKTLDVQRGGPLAVSLGELYTWWMRQILEGMLHKDPETLRQVAAQIQEQREAWAQAAVQAAGQAPGPAPVSPGPR